MVISLCGNSPQKNRRYPAAILAVFGGFEQSGIPASPAAKEAGGHKRRGVQLESGKLEYIAREQKPGSLAGLFIVSGLKINFCLIICSQSHRPDFGKQTVEFQSV